MIPMLSLLGPLSLIAAADGPEADYLRDIKPLLASRCVTCHGAEKPRGGLRLDTAAHAHAGGDSGPAIVPGAPEESELYLAVLEDRVGGERMPLKREPLNDREIGLLRDWIAGGAKAPESEEPSRAESVHWSFVPPKRPEPPRLANIEGTVGPIDRFIRAPLERDGIAPAPEADRATLIRRASLDVIGLPPSPEEVAAFLADERPDAYERLVDRLLASPHYGERWGRIWLDMARYADSNGYSIDAPREIWKYRDWVIDALNSDQPFDEFTIDQLAGDLRQGSTLEQRVATGFHRNTQINQEGGIDKEQFRVESIIDRVNTTATVWLGLTVGCAQCHDHKYDPISQREYYQLFAFFNNADEPTIPVASPEEIAAREGVQRKIDEYLRGIEEDEALLAKQQAWETGLDTPGRQKQSQEVREAFDLPFEKRPIERNRVVFAAFVDQSDDPEVRKHRNVVAALRRQIPKVVTTMVVAERAEPRATQLLMGGDYTRPGDPVEPGVLAVLPPLHAEPEGKARPDRMDLARWLVDPGHPLTARVAVNRLWQAYFGRGLVETDDDFGTQGAPPSHPGLLDWLATEFIARGWSLKAMHRLILTSATYRQSSAVRSDLATVDPDNRRLARQSRLRLDAELIRDNALATAGLLNPKVGGPSVFPPQPDGVTNFGQIRREWKADEGPDRYRRGLYCFFWRATPHPLLTGFDAPDANRACTRRGRSNTPLQALMLLNDGALFECAQGLAARVLRDGPGDDRVRLDRAFRIALSRSPGDWESERLLAFLEQQRAGFAAAPGDADGIAPPGPGTAVERASWTMLARVLMNLDEFITRE